MKEALFERDQEWLKYFHSFLHLQLPFHFIHISGGNQTGKSLLVKDFCQSWLEHNASQIFYCDTEQKFSQKNYLKDISPLYLSRIVVRSIKNARDLARIFTLFSNNILPLSKNQDLIIIDSITSLLKSTLRDSNDFFEYKTEINEFFNAIIFPILQLSSLKHVAFILIHHSTYDHHNEKEIAYNQSLFNPLRGLWLYLLRDPVNPPFFNMTFFYSHLYQYKIQIFEKKLTYILEGSHLKIISQYLSNYNANKALFKE